MEPVSWDTETKPQRKMCVSLEDYLAATPIGCGYVDQRVVNTARNSNAIAAFRAVHDVSGPDSEIYRQESYFSGPCVGVEYASIMDINPVQGSFGDLYPTLSSTPIAENTMIRALRGTTAGADAVAGGAHVLWAPTRAEASIRSILAATGLANTTSLMGYLNTGWLFQPRAKGLVVTWLLNDIFCGWGINFKPCLPSWDLIHDDKPQGGVYRAELEMGVAWEGLRNGLKNGYYTPIAIYFLYIQHPTYIYASHLAQSSDLAHQSWGI